ncbi:hypothetical protein NDI85_20000 [Halomicroarcula sp. S1AR25-4]|uniref:hypothetical protein n=1 Tax=Haloarcula sp. S1AR25-4 TaxID=2950538 RepID=UPI00287623F7|nr:hypothetical protein [Halomicroarcula sp. S1AR25-4]MDS0280072.1 hypothetical protein [Halomicroarcula sp. S1AR25-4]
MTDTESTDTPTDEQSINHSATYLPFRIADAETRFESDSDASTPIGKLRAAFSPADSGQDELSYNPSNHLLCSGLPRRGVSMAITSIAETLVREHPHKVISVMGDGRMETPMWAVPNDDPAARERLESFDVEPSGTPTDVFVPATDALPDTLPENFTEFTIGIDSLTPTVLLHIAGVDTSDATLEGQIQRSLDETLADDGDVANLIGRLEERASATDATVEWTERKERDEGAETVETYTAPYEMDAEGVLETVAARIALLRAEGILAPASAATNIDIDACLADAGRAAVLCTQFLSADADELQYVLTDLWLQLVYNARDNNPRLPPVAAVIPELKRVAPARLSDATYTTAVAALRQTVFKLAVQGMSRRMTLLAGTHCLQDVYKSVRANFPDRLLLEHSDEGLDFLDRTHELTTEQKDALRAFDVGSGMYLTNGRAHCPIQLRPPRCSVGDGDGLWIDRYGTAVGARVRSHTDDGWGDTGPAADADWWVHTPTAAVYDTAREPLVTRTYSEWYLLPQDFAEVLGEVPDPADVDASLVDDVLEARREYEVPNDLTLQEIDD